MNLMNLKDYPLPRPTHTSFHVHTLCLTIGYQRGFAHVDLITSRLCVFLGAVWT